MKKIALLLVMLLAVTVISSCAENKPEMFEVDFTPGDVVDRDFGGATVILTQYAHFLQDETYLLGFTPGGLFYDMARDRVADVEERFNCHVTVNAAEGFGTDFDRVRLAASSGQYIYDAILMGSYWQRDPLEAGLFEPLSSVSDIIDYTNAEKWGTPNMLEWMAWDGDLYGVIPASWPESTFTSHYIFAFNEEFTEKRGQPDPREYVENGTWDRDMLGEMATEYTFMDGSEQVYGLCVYKQHFMMNALRANDALTELKKDGGYVSGIHTEAGIEALTWAHDFISNTHKNDIFFVSSEAPAYEAFNLSKIALLLMTSGFVYGSEARIAYEIENYAMLPFPNGPYRKSEEYTSLIDAVRNTIMFPITGKDVDMTATIVNAIFEPFEGYETEESLKDYYLKYFFHDERDYNLLMQVVKNGRYSYFGDGFQELSADPLTSDTAVPSTILGGTEDIYAEKLQKYVVPTITTMNEIFGEDWAD